VRGIPRAAAIPLHPSLPPDVKRSTRGFRRPKAVVDGPSTAVRPCSRWGLPCHIRRRICGEPLPRLFTLTAHLETRRGSGMFSVALSVRIRPWRHRLRSESVPDVIRHRALL